jgi:hypothetical protein
MFILIYKYFKRTLYDVWDTARVTDNEETYEERVHFFHLSLQILKVVTYVVLSLTLLLCAILSKGTFLLMTNAIGHVETVIFICVSRLIKTIMYLFYFVF